jgi:hypothetical protein
MIDRSKRGIRSVGVKARLAVAAAVLVGGGAAGVVVLAANHGGANATTADSAGFMTRSHQFSEQTVLTDAVNSRGNSQSRTLALLAELTQLHSFVQLEVHHTAIAAQRGVVVLATKKFLVVRSANGALHLWWWNRETEFQDVDATMTGMTALTGSHMAATAAMIGNMAPAANVMVGSMGRLNQLTTPMAQPSTITINTGGTVITITVASATATVAQPMSTLTGQMMNGQTTRTHQSAWWATHGLQRGDLVFIAGTRMHGELKADLVLFAPTGGDQMMPTPSPSASMTASATAVPTPNTTISGQPVEIGTNS